MKSKHYEIEVYCNAKQTKSEFIDIVSSYVKDKDGFVYFYNQENGDDLDHPIAIFNKNIVKRILSEEME